MKNSRVVVIFAVLALFLMLGFASSGTLVWDESVYVGMGKYVYSNGKIGLWEPIRPPGLPLLAGFFWILGIDAILFSKITMLLFSLGCVWLTFTIGEKVFDRNTGLMAAVLMSLTPVFFMNSSVILTGIPSAFFALLSIHFFLHGRPMAAGAIAGISFLFRFPQGIMLAALLVGSYLYKRRLDRGIMAGFGLAVLPFFMFNLISYGNPLLPFIAAYSHQFNAVYSVMTGSLASYGYNLFYYLIGAVRQNLLFIFFIPGAVLLLKRQKKQHAVIISAAMLFMIYFTYIVNKQPRFMLIFLPYVSLISSYAMLDFIRHWKKHQGVLMMLVYAIILLSAVNTLSLSEIKDDIGAHRYFSTYGDIPVVLSTTPLPIAYSDIRLIPFYNNVDDALETYEKEKSNADFIIYSSEFYPCLDDQCEAKKASLFGLINDSYELVYYEKSDQEYFIFRS